MKVQMKAQISGLRDGKPWPDVDEVVDLPDDEAAQVVASGMAVEHVEPEPEPVKGVKPEPETAQVKAEPETR
jgi:hypothetical protein